MNVLVWFKRDLRIHDHPALSIAAAQGAVLPVYVVEPDYWRLPDTSARQWAFTAEALADLRKRIQNYESAYQPVNSIGLSYIKLFDLSSRVMVNKIYSCDLIWFN